MGLGQFGLGDCCEPLPNNGEGDYYRICACGPVDVFLEEIPIVIEKDVTDCLTCFCCELLELEIDIDATTATFTFLCDGFAIGDPVVLALPTVAGSGGKTTATFNDDPYCHVPISIELVDA